MPKRKYRKDLGRSLIPTIKKIDRAIPDWVPFSLFKIGKQVKSAYITYYYKSGILNRFRRAFDYARGFVASRSIWSSNPELHIGCGPIDKPGAIDIDFLKSEATDYVLDATSLPFPDHSVERIETYHMIEHIPSEVCPALFAEWHRVLEPGGTLVIEVPDFDGVVEEYFETDDPERTELLLEYVFGNQRDKGNVHYWGWNFERLSDRLQEAGFINVEREPAQDFHAETAPCLRVVAKANS